jgi:hypothetical protein
MSPVPQIQAHQRFPSAPRGRDTQSSTAWRYLVTGNPRNHLYICQACHAQTCVSWCLLFLLYIHPFYCSKINSVSFELAGNMSDEQPHIIQTRSAGYHLKHNRGLIFTGISHQEQNMLTLNAKLLTHSSSRVGDDGLHIWL